MKKVIKIVIVLLCFLGVFLVYNYIKPVDDTYKLHIKCNNHSESYSVMINDDIKFATSDEKCKLNLKVEDISRNYIKLNSNTFFYKINGRDLIDSLTLSYDVYVSSDSDLTLVGHDKDTRFEFSYK